VNRPRCARLFAAAATTVSIALLAGCGSGSHRTSSSSSVSVTTPTTPVATTTLPGSNKPPVTIGDKNFTEQFILGALYKQALVAQGYDVVINQNIGPTSVTFQALQSGRLSMYPEYLSTWNSAVAGDTRHYQTAASAYRAGQRFALAHGLTLLRPTPFSDVNTIAVTVAYATQNKLQSIADLGNVQATLALGAPVQFQQSPDGLPILQQAYGVVPATFKALDVGAQYPALDNGSVQAADVNTTDGQLRDDGYRLLSDPKHVFGWGNVVPVVPLKVLAAEGPVFARTIDAVSGLLSTDVIRQLNADVDVAHQDPTAVATRFLEDHGLIAPPPATS